MLIGGTDFEGGKDWVERWWWWWRRRRAMVLMMRREGCCWTRWCS